MSRARRGRDRRAARPRRSRRCSAPVRATLRLPRPPSPRRPSAPRARRRRSAPAERDRALPGGSEPARRLPSTRVRSQLPAPTAPRERPRRDRVGVPPSRGAAAGLAVRIAETQLPGERSGGGSGGVPGLAGRPTGRRPPGAARSTSARRSGSSRESAARNPRARPHPARQAGSRSGSRLALGCGLAHLSSSRSRSRLSPLTIRPFTVPSGIPVRSAIWIGSARRRSAGAGPIASSG